MRWAPSREREDSSHRVDKPWAGGSTTFMDQFALIDAIHAMGVQKRNYLNRKPNPDKNKGGQ